MQNRLLAYTEKKGSSLSEFLLWWQDRKLKEAIVIPEGTDALQIMTIHKSKGLTFNVVMIPFNWEDRKKTTEIWVDTSDYFNKQLPAALVNGNKELEHSYFSSEYQKEKESFFPKKVQIEDYTGNNLWMMYIKELHAVSGKMKTLNFDPPTDLEPL